MEPHVFISYSRANTAIVNRIKDALARAGVDVWLDHERLIPGTPNWQAAVRVGITQATHVIYVASKTAAHSTNVIDEINIAKEEDKTIIPFWILGSKWHACVPIGIGSYQGIDGRGARFDTGLVKLLMTLGLALPTLPRANRLSRRRLLIGAGAVAISTTVIGCTAWYIHSLEPGSQRWRSKVGILEESSPAVENGWVYLEPVMNSSEMP